MGRLNWNDRHSPTDFDNSAPKQETFEFDYCRNTTPGGQSWPDKFGPSSIRKAWANGLVVVAEIEGFPYPVAISEARWEGHGKVLTVKTLEGWKVPQRIQTRSTVKGLRCTGELVE